MPLKYQTVRHELGFLWQIFPNYCKYGYETYIKQTGKHVACQMTATSEDLYFRPFMLDYMKHSPQDMERYIADEARTRKKQVVRHKLELSLAAISLTTANMDMKLT